MSTKAKNKNNLLQELTSNGSVLKGNYGDYYVYRKDWLFDHLEQEFDLLNSARKSRTVKKEEKENILKEAKKINKTPYSTKINEDLGILGN